jgi:hypothetical protein
MTEHDPKKYAKGETSPYKMCLELCKKYNLDATHVKELRKNVAEIRTWGHHVNAFYELLHDQIQLLHADKSYVEIEKSGVLKELGQKIQLSHISRLVGEFLIPKEKPTQFYAPAPGRKIESSTEVRPISEYWEGATARPPAHAEFRGMGVYVRSGQMQEAYGRLHIDFPKVVKALKYFKIQFWDQRKEETAKMIMEIMAEPDMGPIDDPVMEPNPPAVVVHIGEGLGPHRSKGRRLASQGYFK